MGYFRGGLLFAIRIGVGRPGLQQEGVLRDDLLGELLCNEVPLPDHHGVAAIGIRVVVLLFAQCGWALLGAVEAGAGGQPTTQGKLCGPH